MKRILPFLLIISMLLGMCACGGKDTVTKERKRATAGQDTTTTKSSQSEEEPVTDTGVLRALTETYAKSNKAGIVYDPNIFVNLAQDTSGAVKVACVGDSITWGTYASDTAKTSYPAQLGAMLKSSYGNKFKVTNYGHAGAYVADFGRENASTLRYIKTAEFKQLKKDKPDVVIVMLGINDIGYITNGTNASEFQKAYEELLDEISGISSSPYIFVCTPLVRTTAYSSYINQEALNNAVIKAANNKKVCVIDTYSITKQYFGTYLYETDGLHPDDTSYKYLAEIIYDGIVNGYTTYKEGTIAATPKYVVYVDSSKGTYSSNGASADKPTSNLARAVDLCKGGGTIVVSGPITPATTGKNLAKVFIAPENEYKITVTSIDPYNGTDYRSTNGARIYLSGSVYWNGDYEFKHITFDTVTSGVKFVCGYNNITVGAGVSSVLTTGGYPVFIAGHDVVSAFQTADDISCKENCTINLNSGTFSYLRGGNFRVATSADYGTVKSGVKLIINVAGATFGNEDGSTINTDSARLSSAIGQNGVEKGAVAELNVKSGTFKGSLFAVPRMNPYYNSKAPSIAGDININITGGAFLGSKLDFRQTYSGAVLPTSSGSYKLSISGGAFASSGKKTIAAEGCQNSALTLASGVAHLANWATVSGFAAVNK